MNVQLSDHFTYKKLFQFVYPSIIMMIFTFFYSIVDGLFISNFAGKTMLASVNLIMPFIMVLGGVGFMIGVGGNALVSKTLGEGNGYNADRYFTMLVYLTVISGIFISVIGIIFIRRISYVFGATDAMIDNCVAYGRIALTFNTAFMLQNVFQSIFVTAEKSKIGLLVILIAGLSNIVLDALFIAGLGMGIKGAALATGISQCVGSIIPLIYFICPNTGKLKLVRTNLEGRTLLKACLNGSSEMMDNISLSFVSILYNFQLMRLAGENGVAAYAALMYIQFIFMAIFIGYTIGCSPIINYHYGAKNNKELKNMLRKSLLVMSISGITMAFLAQILAYPLAKIFVGYDQELFDMTRHALRIFAISFTLSGLNIFLASFFTALNNGGISATISFTRTLVFQSLSVLLLPILFGVEGIWWANVVAEMSAFTVACIFLFAKRKKYNYM